MAVFIKISILMEKRNDMLSGIPETPVHGNGVVRKTGQVFVSAAGADGVPADLWGPEMRRLSPSLSAGHVAKYADFPVEYSLGLTNIEVPLHRVVCGKLEVPLSIAYHASGIRLEELSEAVGLGWSFNAGGAVVREIRGMMDDGVADHTVRTGGTATLDYLSRVIAGTEDSCWDKYCYSYPGGSGSFLINFNGSGAELVKTSCNDDAITFEYAEVNDGFWGKRKIVERFTVTDPLGNRYEFACKADVRPMNVFRHEVDGVVTDDISVDNSAYITTAWLLTRITSADLADTVEFEYEDKGMLTEKVEGFAAYYRKSADAPDSDLFLQMDVTGQVPDRVHCLAYSCMLLTGIRHRGGRVAFRYTDAPLPLAPELENVPSRYPEGFDLNPERRLAAMLVYDMEGELVCKVSFDNREGEHDVKRFRLNGLSFYDRDSVLYDSYAFEYYGVEGLVSIEPQPEAPQSRYAQDFFGYYNGRNDNSDLNFLTPYGPVEGRQAGKRDYSFHHARYNALKAISRQAGSRTEFLYAPNTHRDAVAGDVSIGLRIAEIRTYDEGTLVRRRTFTYRQSGTTVDFRRLDIADFTERRQVGVAAGRVDEYLVIHSDSVLPGARVENARVFYGEVTEEVTDVRNGKSVRTDYEYDTRLWACDFVSKNYRFPAFPDGEQWKSVSIQDTTEASDGTVHYIGEIRGYFKEKPRFFGNLGRRVEYEGLPDGSYRAVRTTEWTYDLYSPEVMQLVTVGLFVKNMVTTATLQRPVWARETNHMRTVEDCLYFDVTESLLLFRPVSMRVTTCYGDREHTVETGYMYYAPKPYRQWPDGTLGQEEGYTSGLLLRQVRVETDGDVYVQRLLYPTDYDLPVYRKMCAANMLHTPVGVEIVKNDTDKSAVYIGFGEVTVTVGLEERSVFRPCREERYFNGELLAEREIKEFDQYGNPLHIVATGQPETCYVWRYRGMYPVAEIRGASYEQVAAALRDRDDADDIPDSAFMNILNGLRDDLPGALVSTYTYRPMVGMTSATDAAGRMKTFHYDAVGRLNAVKDDCGNLLETCEYGRKSLRMALPDAENVSETVAASPADGVEPCVIGGETEADWYVDAARYLSLGTLRVSDAWSAGILADNNVTVRKLYTAAHTAVSAEDYVATVTYYDSLGEERQRIEVGGSPSGKDIVTPVHATFLKAGEVLSYLPYPVVSSNAGGYRADAVAEQESYYASAFSLALPRPYFRNCFEMSPRGLLLERTQPGFSASVSSRFGLDAAAADDAVLRLSYSAETGGFSVAQAYYGEAGFLEKSTATDEDGHTVETFTDEAGRTVLSRCDGADTYRVYDGMGRLAYVVTPEGAAALEAGISYAPNSRLVVDYCFAYVYDLRGRVAEKQVPGKGWEYYVYDLGGRVLLMQDANMRTTDDDGNLVGGYWVMSDYDALGRLVSRYMCHTVSAATRADYQAVADAGTPLALPRTVLLAAYRYDRPFGYEYRRLAVEDDRWLYVYAGRETVWSGVSDAAEAFLGAGGAIKSEFLIGSFLTPSGRPFLAYYVPSEYADVAERLVQAYDDCELSSVPPSDRLLEAVVTLVRGTFAYEPVEGICTASDCDYRTRGLKTHETLAVVSEGMKTSGAFVGRWFYYDRLGRVIQVVERNVHGSLSRYSMKYDFMGRLVLSEECHSWSDRWEKSDTKRTAYTYDAHGRLLAETVVLNGLEGSVSYGYDDLGRLASKTVRSGGTHVTTHYAYDIRGRLTGLEAPGLYSQEMTYSSGGNIGRIVTGSQVFGREGVVHTYGYDGHNRLCQATRVQQNDRVTYTMNYDGNGNILAHQRTASPNSAEIRRYTYSGNRLASMTRSVSGTSGTSDNYVFGYDLNGNLTFNPERPMQFRYNYLNLTDSIVWPEGGCRYSWLSDGSRASAAGFGSEGGKGRDYLGSLIYDYNQSQLELSTEFSGGRLVSGPSGDSVLLYVQDHLGSVRVVLADGRPAAYNEYAPFGESETAYSTDVFQGQRLAPQYNRFRYNGKEEFPQPGSDLLDYGARLYDPVLCRWNAIDPLAEKYCSLSGYAYCGNNPVRFIDPYGLTIAEGSLQEFGRLRQTIRDKLNSWIALKQQYINAFYAQGNSGEPNTSYFDMMIQSLQRSLALMDIIEMSTHTYKLNFSEGSKGTLKHTPNTRYFTLTYGNDALFVHELTHAGQLENGEIGFTKAGKNALMIDIYDEAAAYAAQYAFSPESVEGLNPSVYIYSMADITAEWVIGIEDATGGHPYGPGGSNHTGQALLNINSTWNEYLGAYHSERRSIREQYGNWGDTPMKDVMENVFNDGFIW